jgi:trk system potassium uptake protein TrkA
MKIVIAGAGNMGFHIAQLLANEQHDIVLIDTDEEVLSYAASHIDVFTIRGNSSSLELLKSINVEKADIFIATTSFDQNNLISSMYAKKLGAKETIARVSNSEYLDNYNVELLLGLGVDHIINPKELAANEIELLVKKYVITNDYEFEEGQISLVGFLLENSPYFIGQTVEEVNAKTRSKWYKPIAILRGNQTIIPNNKTVFQHNDHVYLLLKSSELNRLYDRLGKEKKQLKNIMILGGTPLALHTAKKLESKYNVSLVVNEKAECDRCVEELDKCLVIQGNPSNFDLLLEEGLDKFDVFIALTPNSETNILTCRMAEEVGVIKTIAMVDNTAYFHLSQNIGVDTLINKKLLAANSIFRYVRKGSVEDLTTLHGVNAEIIEFVVTPKSKLIGDAVDRLEIPGQLVIGAVVRKNECLIKTEDIKLKEGDKVIILGVPEAIGEIQKKFN